MFIGVLLALLIAALPVWFIVPVFYGFWKGEKQIAAQEQTLLYHVDDPAILNACMQMYQQKFDWSVGEDDSKIPSVIRDLHPHAIAFAGDHVHIEFGGDNHHFGFDAFPSDKQGSGTKQLISGLWFVDENGEIPQQN
jgi:cbb3-type cytochrome oxidase subunit 3